MVSQFLVFKVLHLLRDFTEHNYEIALTPEGYKTVFIQGESLQFQVLGRVKSTFELKTRKLNCNRFISEASQNSEIHCYGNTMNIFPYKVYEITLKAMFC